MSDAPRVEQPGQTLRAHLVVHGRVQGVGFRVSVHAYAHARGLAGWVRNLDTGEVEAVFEGPEQDVRAAVAWCHEGPHGAFVSSVDAEWDEPPQHLAGFDVRPTGSHRL